MSWYHLPSYVKPDLWLDENNALEFVRWKDDTESYLAMWWHRANTETGWCAGSFAWRNPSSEDFRAESALWTLLSWSPLTVAPSLLCLDCKAHGFIRDGKWVPA